MEKGKLIVLEGIDGAGTTSMAKEVGNYILFDTKESAWITREPYHPQLEPVIRKFIRGEYRDPGWQAMSALFYADRVLHCRDMAPFLDNGQFVVCDRYIGSTLAYQPATAPQEERDDIINFILENFNRDVLVPDITIFIRVDLEVAEARRANRKIVDYYEQRKIQEAVCEGYEKWLKIACQEEGNTVVVVDGNRDYETVKNDCFQAVKLALM